MKKFICLIIFVLFAITIVLHQYNSDKFRDINYTVGRYFTTGIFNEYKMYNIDNKNLYFSNGVDAYIKVSGFSNSKPHKAVHYEVLLEKNKRGIWKVAKVYPY